jgi:prepilin-type N-terminal cleavage/methylation domain-containing protein
MSHTQSVMQKGFTLIELAIAVFVIALLVGMILVPLATQVEQRQNTETQKTMEDVRDALLGHAAAKGYLPCPDLTTGTGANDGVEDVTANRCPNRTTTSGVTFVTGNLPWSTLGLANQDAWGNRLRYTVVEDFARRDTVFSLGTVGGLRVCRASNCSSTLTTTAVAVIISHGLNGYGAINAITSTANTAPTSSDEVLNQNGTRDAVYREKSTVAATEFDDLVVWLPQYTLANRMIAAGRLP